MAAPVNVPLPSLAGVGGKVFRCAACCLLFLAASLAGARAGAGPPAGATNSPTVFYVTAPRPEVTNGLGCWIWAPDTFNKQTVRLWQRFELPKTNPLLRAELRIAADNAFKVWLDGQELGSGSDWRTLSIYHLEGTLPPGPHVLAVEGFNDNDQAGIILGLQLDLADGQALHLRSDPTWRVVPDADRRWETLPHPPADWPHAAFASNFGRIPWWTIPTSVLHIRGTLPQPIPVWRSRGFQAGLFAGSAAFVLLCLALLIQLLSQSKAHRLVQAERDRIARDLHDDLGSKLTQLLLTGELAQIGSPPASAAPLSQMCDDARSVLATIDEVVWIVNSQHDNLEDFAIYVCKYAQRFLEATAIRCRLDVAAELPAQTLSQLMRRNLFLAVKEALNNAAKHSQATELTVHIELSGVWLNVVVADNGRGFAPAQANPERNGLSNMKQRMLEIGGECKVASRPGEGCRVSFLVPLRPRSWFRKLPRVRPQNEVAPKTPWGGEAAPVTVSPAQ